MLILFAKPAHASVQTPAQIEDYIWTKSIREGVPVSLAVSIARAESGFVANAKNPESSASGVFQFLDKTFQTYCIDKYHLVDSMKLKNRASTQVNCAIEMLKEPNGWKHWLDSHENWRYNVVI